VKPQEKVFLFEYYHNGARWVFEMPADDLNDAQARLRKLTWAKPLGELGGKVPAGLGLGFIVRALCWLRNSLAAGRG